MPVVVSNGKGKAVVGVGKGVELHGQQDLAVFHRGGAAVGHSLKTAVEQLGGDQRGRSCAFGRVELQHSVVHAVCGVVAQRAAQRGQVGGAAVQAEGGVVDAGDLQAGVDQAVQRAGCCSAGAIGHIFGVQGVKRAFAPAMRPEVKAQACAHPP